jgi:ABC-2 type transport system ATP-binding protein
MRQKLIMTSIFMLNQPLIIVDEPMVGLDPKSARIVKELFKSKAKSGTTVFLSTHSMEIAEELCDRIGIIVKGEIKACGTMDNLRNQASDTTSNLEDIFLELTGAFELQTIIKALQNDSIQSSSTTEGKA